MCLVIWLTISDNPIRALDVLSDPNAYHILERMYVANNEGMESHVVATQVKISPSEFYRLMSSLRKHNMIERRDQRYFVTFFGKAVFNSKRLVQKALDNYHKLKALDSLEEQQQIPASELTKIIGIFVEDHQLKDILTNSIKQT